MYNSLKIQNVILKSVIAFLIIANSFIYTNLASAITSYPPGALLQPNDVTSSHIRDNTIVNVDISTSAAISATKIAGGTPAGDIMLSNGMGLATSTSLHFATSTNDLYVFGGRIHATSTNFNSVNYTWPTADGTINQVLKTNGAGTLAFTDLAPSVLKASLISGEAITAGMPLFIATSTNNRTTVISSAGTNPTNLSNAASAYEVQQSFTEATHVGQIKLWLKTVGSPTDAVRVSIRSNATGGTRGTDLMSGTIGAGSLTGSFAQYTVSLGDIQPTNSATTYYIVIGRTGGNDGTNYFQVYGDASPPYAGGTKSYWDGATWTNQPEDMRFELVDNFIAGRVYQTSGANYNYANNFVGFATATVASSTASSIDVTGTTASVSGLATNIWYFLSNTMGTLSTTAGTFDKSVGTALSATTLYMIK